MQTKRTLAGIRMMVSLSADASSQPPRPRLSYSPSRPPAGEAIKMLPMMVIGLYRERMHARGDHRSTPGET